MIAESWSMGGKFIILAVWFVLWAMLMSSLIGYLSNPARGDSHFHGHVLPIFCNISPFFSSSPVPQLDPPTLFLIVTL